MARVIASEFRAPWGGPPLVFGIGLFSRIRMRDLEIGKAEFGDSTGMAAI